MKLAILKGSFTIHRFGPRETLPPALGSAAPCWIARTDDELSIVCDAEIELESPKREGGWSCLRVCGPLDFALTGILAKIAQVLAAAKISIFAVSTFDTDYILVKTDRLEQATGVLRDAGYKV